MIGIYFSLAVPRILQAALKILGLLNVTLKSRPLRTRKHRPAATAHDPRRLNNDNTRAS